MKKPLLYLVFFYAFCIALSCANIFAQQPLQIESAQNSEEKKDNLRILVISSYNPDATRIHSTIVDFINEVKALGSNVVVDIENLNCKSNLEFLEWRSRLQTILTGYFMNFGRPDFVLLLGQEAFTSYLSQDKELTAGIPIIAGAVSYNVVLIPKEQIDPSTWMPNYSDVRDTTKFPDLRGGFVYSYDLVKNVEMIKQLYPNTTSIAFLSDNSYGGVTMQSLVRDEMQRHFPEMQLILLDGRKKKFFEIQDELLSLPKECAILVGTWRIDSSERFYYNDALALMRQNTPNNPVFALSSVGIGQWAIGGYIPQYILYGKQLAQQVIELSQNPSLNLLQTLGHDYLFDWPLMTADKIEKSQLPEGSVIQNEPLSFFEQNRIAVLIVTISVAVLILLLLFSLFIISRTTRFNKMLQKSENDLKEAKEAAEESNRLKSAFLANMSHEIRTPLNAIVGFSEVLAETEEPEEKQTCLSIINSNNSLLLQLIGDILDLSTIEANTIVFKEETFDLNGIFSELEASFRVKIHNEGKPVEVVFERQYQEIYITTDRNRIIQVLTNFLSNACKFTDIGSIKLGFYQEGEYIKCYVTDSGIGIPKDKIPVVFDRFVKLNDFKVGTGLGLSISKTIVQRINGEIGVYSDIGKGSTFWFTIPLTLATHDAQLIPIEKEPQQTESSNITNMETNNDDNKKPIALLLVAEDNEDNYLLYEILLKNKYVLMHAKNGVEAVDMYKIKHQEISAILMDIKMPLMDGYQAVELIRKENTQVPIIAVTAYAFENDKQTIKQKGFDDYISKPIAVGVLDSVLKKWVK